VGKYSTWLACGLVAVAVVAAGAFVDRLLNADFVFVLAFAAIAAAYLLGTFGATLPLFGSVVRTRREDGRFALTFDDGPDPEFTPKISKLLAEREHRATFFVLGSHARKHPRILEQLLADGHELANHGYDHGLLAFSRPAALRRQVQQTEEAILAATQRQPAQLFRAPHGVRSPWLGTTLTRLGYRVCGWTGSSFDTAKPGVDTIVERSCRRLQGGSILLLHDGDGSGRADRRNQTVEALPAILDEAERRGLRSVWLSSLVERP
jgi:peptidoglycan/xylan/chitin deacetylase (PgdA/CDA1 family)